MPTNTMKMEDFADVLFIEKKQNIGEISNDTTISIKYRLINSGVTPLQILDVNPDCICTDKYIPDSIIMPSDTGIIDLRFSSQGKIGYNKINALVKLNTKRKYYKISAEIYVAE